MSVLCHVAPEVVADHLAVVESQADLRKVPNRIFREAFLASGLRLSDVASRLGWRRKGWSDTSRVKRVLGLAPPGLIDGQPAALQTKVSYANAVKLCDALGLDYYEAGI